MGVNVLRGKCSSCGSIGLLCRCCREHPKFVCFTCASANHVDDVAHLSPMDRAVLRSHMDRDMEAHWKQTWHIERGWN